MTLGATEVRGLLERHGLAARRSLGQNFVTDPGTVRRIVALAGIGPGSPVLEVGPGVGSLTLALVEAGAEVTAVEKDPSILAVLEEVLGRVPPPRRPRVMCADAIGLDWGGVVDDRDWSLVANLPYNVAVPIMLGVLDGAPTVRQMWVMVQDEVAERLCAPPGRPDHRRAHGQGRVVRLGPHRHGGVAGGVHPAATGPLGGGGAAPAPATVDRGRARGGVHAGRPGLPAAAQDASGHPRRPGARRRRSRPPGSTHGPGPSSSRWPSGRRWRPRPGTSVGRVPILRAPAKLTLSLRVTGRRDDGYHLIDAEMVTLDFGDRLELDPEGDGLEVRVGAASRPGRPDDLVVRALRLVGRTAGVVLHKSVPQGAGLGGGSADAAAVLRWAGWTDLAGAASLGADVPFCLVGGRARVRGIGEVVEPLALRGAGAHPAHPAGALLDAGGVPAWDELGGPAGSTATTWSPRRWPWRPSSASWRDELAEVAGVRPGLAGSGSTWCVPGAFPGGGRVVTRAVPSPG